MTPITSDSIKAALFGLCIGDALGVPVEFSFRSERSRQPITDMTGYGTYNQAPGTWSDDSSLTFCLAEALCQEFDLNVVARYFLDWYQNNYWTAHDDRFRTRRSRPRDHVSDDERSGSIQPGFDQ